MSRLLDRFQRITGWCVLLLEAALYLLLARLALKVAPFKYLTWFFERPACCPELSGSQRDEARTEVQRAIWLVAPRLPGKTVCFPKAIAAQALLRRRRVGTVLYYGAKTGGGKGLQAHAWVQDGTHPIIGRRASQGFTVLACYSSASQNDHRRDA